MLHFAREQPLAERPPFHGAPCVAAVVTVVVMAGRQRRRRQCDHGWSCKRGLRHKVVAAASADVATPPPLLKRLQRSLTFYSCVIPVITQYAVRPWLHEVGLEPLGGDKLMEEMDEWGSTKLRETLLELGGFYVKTGQVLSTRVDLFSEPYTRKLRVLQDSLPPVPGDEIRQVVSDELTGGRDLREIFREFDTEPLGTASIAQVHRAVLNDGRRVAVKVLRPNGEGILRGDIANLKIFALALRGKLPVDYYPVFCELERALDGELDFLAEAQSALKVAASIRHTPLGGELEAPLAIPMPINGMATRSVLVMEYIEGTPLSQLEKVARERGIDLDGPMGKALGRQILEALTTAYGNMIFSSGFVHGDPHPGNIFVMEGGRIALIDCGQVAQLFRDQRLLVAEAIIAAAAYDGSPKMIKTLADVVRNFGVRFFDDTQDEDAAAASVCLYLFGDADVEFPGGYSKKEFSGESPLRRLASFPQELVLLGRASVLVKGVAARLGVQWSVAKKWEPLAKEAVAALCDADACRLPAWALPTATPPLSPSDGDGETRGPSRMRFKDATGRCASLLKQWGIQKASSVVAQRRRQQVEKADA